MTCIQKNNTHFENKSYSDKCKHRGSLRRWHYYSPNPNLLWKNLNSLAHRKYTTWLPSTIPKSSLLHLLLYSFPTKFPVFVSKFHLNIIQCHLIPPSLLFLKCYHYFLLHLLMKSLNFCMHLLINNVTSTISHLPPKTILCNYSS